MAIVTTTSSLGGLLSIPNGSFDDALIAGYDFFAGHFQQVVYDALTGNGYAYYASNTFLSAHVYGANGDAEFYGSGFLGYSGGVNQIHFEGEGGSFTVKGSGSWNANNVTLTGYFTSIESYFGNDGMLLEGRMNIDDNGYLVGRITHQAVYSDNMTVEYFGTMSASDLSGNVTKIVLRDDSGNSITVTGNYTVSAFQAVIDDTNSPDEVLNTASLFNGNDIFTVVDASRDWHGFAGNDRMTGGGSIDNLFGDDGSDNLIGLGGDDTLNGGAGVDVMSGGLGDDCYYVDSALDKVVELPGGGQDTVISLANYILSANVENLALADSGNINGTGNTLENVITGNSGNNILNGGLGADILIGNGGNDTFIVDNYGDSVTADSGNDTVIITLSNPSLIAAVTIDISNFNDVENLSVFGKGLFNLSGDGENNILTGNASANTLIGNGGHDIFDGGAGADVMIGGDGNDTFTVDNLADFISDTGGMDAVIVKLTSGTYTLSGGLESMVLAGTAAINGTGDSNNNTITGNAGKNILNGGNGADHLIGGGGNDTYIIDNIGDTVNESSNGGTDIVQTEISFDLGSSGSNVENLTLRMGAGDINGTGNAQANVILGNEGANTLDGGDGIDKLVGGFGDDTYIIDLFNSSGVAKLQDKVTESRSGGDDTLVLRASGDIGLINPTTFTVKSGIENIDISLTFSNKINLLGNSIDNTLTGNDWSNTLNGGSGNDTLSGETGLDTLLGMTGNDVLLGGLDSDFLDGGAGADTLTGGEGADQFVFHATQATLLSNADVITDFTAGLGGDKLDIRDILAGRGYIGGSVDEFVHLTEIAGDTVVSVDANGLTNGATFIQIATLTGITGLNADQLVADANLIVL
jgi:Ca2+-binding RTX toxin-like protein